MNTREEEYRFLRNIFEQLMLDDHNESILIQLIQVIDYRLELEKKNGTLNEY